MLCLAAGKPFWQRLAPGEVAVMVDLSPSTRTADFRTRSRLESRIRSLLGKVPYHVYYFASQVTRDAPQGEILPDLPTDQTLFKPLPAQAIVLFSDARFDLPDVAPPTYVILDPALESPADASVISLQVRGKDIVANASNTGAPRGLIITGSENASAATVSTGSIIVIRPLDAAANAISARLSKGDAWPENDQLVAVPPPRENNERWWIGASTPPGWKSFAATAMSTDAAAYLAPSTIVLENIAATDLAPLQLQRLHQYVRDLGGGLVILGGDRAFAAGGYQGTELEALSPLASTPPRPTTHWMLLADGSGSMAEVQEGFSLWRQATDAMTKLIPYLPPDDLLNVGSFSDSLTWWSANRSVRQTEAMTLPPQSAGPHGPTNLEDVLLELAKNADASLPKHLLLLTDAEAEIKDPAALARALKARSIHLHLLAIGDGTALPALQIIIGATGGTLAKQLDPRKWTEAIQRLMRSGAPTFLGRMPLPIHFQGEFSALPRREVFPWNRTWLKTSATLLAEGIENEGQPLPAVAKWNVGEGQVLAFAFNPGTASAEALARAAAGMPRDPKYRVSWEMGSHLRLAIDATDGPAYLNGKQPRVELSSQGESGTGTTAYAIPQTGPGRYELNLPAPRTPTFATVRVANQMIDRIAVAGRYAPEFDAIGNDHEAMRELAARTGGQVIPPRQTWPIDFHWRKRPMDLTSLLAIAGASLILASLGWWKLRG